MVVLVVKNDDNAKSISWKLQLAEKRVQLIHQNKLFIEVIPSADQLKCLQFPVGNFQYKLFSQLTAGNENCEPPSWINLNPPMGQTTLEGPWTKSSWTRTDAMG